MRQAIEGVRPDALIVIGAEHFANFFMNNMPAICVGMAEHYEGPIEDEAWLGIERHRIPGAPELARDLIQDVMSEVDLAYAQEWKFDHGIMVPLHFLTPRYELPVIPVNINCQGPPLIPLHRCYGFGRALRRACDRRPERIAVIGTGGISHWPATPDSGRINERWDREFLEKFLRNDRQQLIAYRDDETWHEAGQGGFEIRTFIAVSGATEGCAAELWFYAPIPIFAVGCTVAVVKLSAGVG
jgi:aromatic ring-opening dioxygenase catalytic subunit (LigB family)